MPRIKLSLKLILIFVSILGLGLVFFIKQNYSYKSSALTSPEVFPVLSPTQSPAISQKTNMDSPDGKMTLILESKKNENEVSFFVYTSNLQEIKEKLIFQKDELARDRLSIPYNSWSPNNEFFFLKEETSLSSNYYVFYANGNNFSNGRKYLNVGEFFNREITGHTITDVTGWAAQNLLIVNTQSTEGKNKFSFWFDVKNRNFTRLSTYFY